MLGGAQVVELVESHLFLERRLGGKAVQEHRQPPGHTCGGPHATQRHVGIAIEVMRFSRAVRLGQRPGQRKNVGNRQVKALRPGRGDDVGGVAGQEQRSITHRLGDKAAQWRNGFFDRRASDNTVGHVLRTPRLEFLPEAVVRPVL